MNRNLALAFAAIIAAAGHVRADDITMETTPFKSTASRAQVRAELMEYRKSAVDPWAKQYNPLMHFSGSRTRAEVTAEYLAHRDSVAALNGEDSGSAYLARRDMPQSARTQMAGMAE